ncbi:alpha/beta-hydrolase family protein [Arthrobacter psychrolactophilus]
MGAAGVGYAVVIGLLTISWQNDVRDKVDMPAVDGVDLLTFFAVASVMAGVVFGAHRGLTAIAALARGWASRVSERPVVIRGSGILAGALGAVVVLSFLVSAALVGTDRVYAARNATTPAAISEPDSSARSAGPESAVDWDKLGMQGRAFVGGGPTAAEITAVTHEPAKTPVRVYVGEQQEDSLAARAELAVAELKRTGGFERSTLMVATPTGSGWLERQAIDSLEYLQGGDTAIVSLQYSYQPSWVSFLFHQDLPREAGQALFAAVHEQWLSLPERERPRLLVYGLSLGASGMQAAFSDSADMLTSVDGAVFSGAPNNSQPWGTLQEQRDAGSPPWQPVYDGGKNIRWLSNNGDLEKLPGSWDATRVAYLQHGTDAVTWLTPRLIWSKPDWLGGSAASGGRAPDVSDSMRWIPGVTYLQVAFDMFMGESVPALHGHNFGDVAVDAWNGVAPSGLDENAVERIQSIIAAYAHEDSMDN